jgi:hypothetical protein
MARTKLGSSLAIAWALALMTQGGNAASLNSLAEPTLKEGVTASRVMLETHGCHYSCQCGPPKDFGCGQFNHRHLHMLCLPVRCADRDTDCERRLPEGACRHTAPR